MSQLVVLVVTDPEKTHQVIEAWLEAGARSVMMIEVRGLAHFAQMFGARDDIPLIPSLESVIQPREEPYQALLDIVPDEFDPERLVAATEKVTGPLSRPKTGILFVIPVSRMWGRPESANKLLA